MSNPLLTTYYSKVDSWIKEPSGVGSTPDCFKSLTDTIKIKSFFNVFEINLQLLFIIKYVD